MKAMNNKPITETIYDVDAIRQDFPILHRPVYGKRLSFLDNAASTQKPWAVINAVKQCYEEEYANIHRGVYYLSMQATEQYEATREKVRAFINANETREIIFVRGATEAINLVAHSNGQLLNQGDEIIISEMEHHSNIVPWQMLRDEKGIILRVVPINDAGELIYEEYEKLLTTRTKLVAITHISNALGTITPIKRIIDAAHANDSLVLVDGCQAVPHIQVDVQELDADFYAFSSHKMYGPTGTGILYGKADLLEAMPPYQGGGEMIRTVSFDKTTYNTIPHKFEAGTPAIAQVIGFGAAIDYLREVGLNNIHTYEETLLTYLTERLAEVDGIQNIGTAQEKASIQSFNYKDVHPHDIGTILDREGVAVRAGHHCAQPVMQHFDVAATARASLGMYNTKEDIDQLIDALGKVKEFFD